LLTFDKPHCSLLAAQLLEFSTAPKNQRYMKILSTDYPCFTKPFCKWLICFTLLLMPQFQTHAQGKMYGMTFGGGTSDFGVLFEFDLATNTYTKKFDFDGVNGGWPQGGFAAGNNGKLYGMTRIGGDFSAGVLFEYDPATSAFTKKFDFDGPNGASPKGGSPVLGSNGKFYGTTTEGGSFSAGVLFEYDPVTNTYTKKFDFNSTDGVYPLGSLSLSSNGKFYGTTSEGGTFNSGVLFEYDPTTNTYTKKLDLGPLSISNPKSTLVSGNNGKLYGLSYSGGSGLNGGQGVLFEYDPTTNGLTIKFDFGGVINGTYPEGSLALASNGKFYGMTSLGGTLGNGVLFEYDPATSTFTKKLDFNGIVGTANGSRPFESLALAGNGKFYGMTSMGGTSNFGVMFEYDPIANVYVKKIDFTGAANGRRPLGDLLFVKPSQTITFAPLTDKTFGDAAFSLTASSSSSLPVSFSTSTPTKVTVSGSQVSLIGAGRANIIASQAGNANFNAATSVDRSFCVKPAKPTVTLSNSNTESPTLTSSATSGNQWFLNGAAISGATNATYNATAAGVYKVQVKVDDCVSEFSLDQALVVTGDLTPSLATSFNAYPNPAENYLFVDGVSNQAVSKVTNQVGAPQAIRQEIKEGQLMIYTGELAAGFYVLQVQQQQQLRVIKFIKL
jgi:uncharacterized repeat protein (TIGR03803 family)